MRLGLDLETSGLWRDDLPAGHLSQPNIVQIGAILFDAKWMPVAKIVTLIKPDNWVIEPGAEAAHGISVERCAQYGIPIVVALLGLKAFCQSAVQVFAHNAAFEQRVIGGQLAKLSSDDFWWRKKSPSIVCTMELSTGPCALPNPRFPGYKWPSLEEAMRRFYPQLYRPTKHEAEADVMDAAMIAQALEREGLWPDPFKRGATYGKRE